MLEKIRNDRTDQLFRAILELQSLEECYAFFDDLCTIGEVQSLSQRLDVAVMLKNRQTYDKIQTQTGASTATISRIRRCVDYGSGGYNLIVGRLDGQEGSKTEQTNE
ncbi:hypothetical protein NCCP2716_23020 [Sporosarcina sp. NCCP-2716]|uniref:YerC/YecD family TrpR-related protein n=1 Tax=Sporosarcina sp. NCCP-2716 TaxID=2943679 RepID=UPI00203C96D6|nr:YerC/YecD family TrpR-related protein [Sporosarcina sp. NCCP-2716]GKV69804.1 hypothetical protein NCCP2716_23020 [Sporosarcina sp. NCCP-2716]